MNKRFWEIVELADLGGGDDPDIRDQIFANLIIKECIDQLKIDGVPKQIAAGLNLGRVAIEEHFGIDHVAK